jgi:hypothetical protein
VPRFAGVSFFGSVPGMRIRVQWAASVTAAGIALACAALAGCVADDTAEPPGGDINHYDPVGAYAGVAAYAGPGAMLVKMEIWHLRADGTIDLEAKYAPRAMYDFVRPAVKSAADEALPVGARGTTTGFETVAVEISEPRMWSVTINGNRHDERHLGMDRRYGGNGSGPADAKEHALPPPTCALKALWADAIAAGAPKDAVADIRYERDGWRFTIADIGFNMERTGADCAGKKPAEAGPDGK